MQNHAIFSIPSGSATQMTVLPLKRCDRKWPHKNGGRNIPGDEGHHHNFAMSCILQNTFNAYIEINSINPVEYEFKKYCAILSDKLFEHADIIDCA